MAAFKKSNGYEPIRAQGRDGEVTVKTSNVIFPPTGSGMGFPPSDGGYTVPIDQAFPSGGGESPTVAVGHGDWSFSGIGSDSITQPAYAGGTTETQPVDADETTVPYWDKGSPKTGEGPTVGDDLTVGPDYTVGPGYTSTTPVSPAAPKLYPAGWLVCVAGELLGRSFQIDRGRNSLGRSDKNRIVVDDPGVSRATTAYVIYDDKVRSFIVTPGEGNTLCYLNGSGVYGPAQMKRGDVLEVGNMGCKLMLIPCCDENFSWTDALK